MQQTSDISRPVFRRLAVASSEEHKAAVNPVSPSTAPWLSHQVYFASLFDPDRALSFACDPCGNVQLDELSERARNNYFLARTAVGRDYSIPRIIALENDATH